MNKSFKFIQVRSPFCPTVLLHDSTNITAPKLTKYQHQSKTAEKKEGKEIRRGSDDKIYEPFGCSVYREIVKLFEKEVGR